MTACTAPFSHHTLVDLSTIRLSVIKLSLPVSCITSWSTMDPIQAQHPRPMPKTGSPFPFSSWEYFIHKATLAGDTDLLCGPTMSCLGALPAVMHQMMLTNLCWLLQLTGISGTRLFPKLYCFIPCDSISLWCIRWAVMHQMMITNLFSRFNWLAYHAQGLSPTSPASFPASQYLDHQPLLFQLTCIPCTRLITRLSCFVPCDSVSSPNCLSSLLFKIYGCMHTCHITQWPSQWYMTAFTLVTSHIGLSSPSRSMIYVTCSPFPWMTLISQPSRRFSDCHQAWMTLISQLVTTFSTIQLSIIKLHHLHDIWLHAPLSHHTLVPNGNIITALRHL